MSVLCTFITRDCEIYSIVRSWSVWGFRLKYFVEIFFFREEPG